MQTFEGFGPFKEMVDRGKIPVGAIILVAKLHELSPYEVLGVQQQGGNTIYRVQHSHPSNARNILEGAVWYT